jgi:hypothetical protein
MFFGRTFAEIMRLFTRGVKLFQTHFRCTYSLPSRNFSHTKHIQMCEYAWQMVTDACRELTFNYSL